MITARIKKAHLEIEVQVEKEHDLFKILGFWLNLPDVCPIDGMPVTFSHKSHDNNDFYSIISTGPIPYEHKVGQKKGTNALFYDNRRPWRYWDHENREEVHVDDNGNRVAKPGEDEEEAFNRPAPARQQAAPPRQQAAPPARPAQGQERPISREAAGRLRTALTRMNVDVANEAQVIEESYGLSGYNTFDQLPESVSKDVFNHFASRPLEVADASDLHNNLGASLPKGTAKLAFVSEVLRREVKTLANINHGERLKVLDRLEKETIGAS